MSIACVLLCSVVVLYFVNAWREKSEAVAALNTSVLQEIYQKGLKYEEGISKEPNNFEYYNAAGFQWKSLGDATGKKYFYKRALRIYEKGLRNKNAKSALFYLNSGNIYRALQDFENADMQYKLAIDLNPGDDVMHRARIELFMAWKAKTPTDVLEVFDIALKTLLFTVNVSLEKAGYLASLGRFGEALKIYEAVKVAYPDQPNIDQKIQEMKENALETSP